MSFLSSTRSFTMSRFLTGSRSLLRPQHVPKNAQLIRSPIPRRFNSSNQKPPNSSAPNQSRSNFPIIPILAIMAIGSGSYMLLVKSRTGANQSPATPEPTPSTPTMAPTPSPRFSTNDVTVVFFLGGPGSGKGTQSANLVKNYNFVHLSAGDLLRAEQIREGSQYGAMIKEFITEGKIVPMEVTVALLSNAMAESLSNNPPAAGTKARFLIDGFPRKLDQAEFFESTVCPSELVLFLDCPEDVMEARLLKRGETSGRDDDNAASIRKRFRTFVDTSMPVVDAFRAQDKVVDVKATGSVDEVYGVVKAGIEERGVHPR